MENTTEVTQGFTKVNSYTFHGTVKDFVENGLKVNGQFVDQVGLSVFGRYGMLKVVGSRKPARGKPAAVYQIEAGEGSMFSFGG